MWLRLRLTGEGTFGAWSACRPSHPGRVSLSSALGRQGQRVATESVRLLGVFFPSVVLCRVYF